MAPTKWQKINATFSVGEYARVNTLGSKWEINQCQYFDFLFLLIAKPGLITGSFRWLNGYEQHTILCQYIGGKIITVIYKQTKGRIKIN